MWQKLSAEKTTIQAAARSLGVSTKTVQRYLAKGVLTKIKEGTRTFVLISEVDKLSSMDMGARRPETQDFRAEPEQRRSSERVILSRERYESLLVELGELRKEKEFNLEIRNALGLLHERLTAFEHSVENQVKRLDALEYGLSIMEKRISEGVSVSLEREGDPKSTKLPKPWWQK